MYELTTATSDGALTFGDQILLFWGSLAENLKEECRKKPVGDLVNRCEALFWEVGAEERCEYVGRAT